MARDHGRMRDGGQLGGDFVAIFECRGIPLDTGDDYIDSHRFLPGPGSGLMHDAERGAEMR